jgi:flagellar assembly protein FliH
METLTPGVPEPAASGKRPSDKDPAAVGLRRILSRAAAESIGTALHLHAFESFSGGDERKIATARNEMQLIRLERLVEELREEMIGKAALARQAVARAFEGGYHAGRETGAAEANAAGEKNYAGKIASLQDRVSAVLNAVEAGKRSFLSSAEDLLLELSFRMAKKIIGAEPALNKGAVLPVLKRALANIAERENLVVRVAAEDYAAVSEQTDFWTPVGERLTGITVEPDERIGTGGCIIESANGIIDARPEVQMGELTDIVEKAWQASFQEATP